MPLAPLSHIQSPQEVKAIAIFEARCSQGSEFLCWPKSGWP